MTAIKDQRRLMQTELATGAFYGDERSFKGQREGNGLSFDDDLSAADLEDLISPSEPEAENAADPEATGVLDLENPQETGVVASAPVAPQGFVSSPVATSTAAADDMLLFLEGAVPDVPQAVVGQPKNTISVVEQSSEVDDFLSILGTL
jgi:hypothetical protein